MRNPPSSTPAPRARRIIHLIASVFILSLMAPTARAAERFDVYPGARSACRVLAEELARLADHTPQLRGRPLIVRTLGPSDPQVQSIVASRLRVQLTAIGVKLSDSLRDRRAVLLSVTVEQADRRVAISAAWPGADVPPLAIAYQDAPWVEARAPYTGVCEIGDTPEQAAIEAREAAEEALRTRVEAALPPAGIADGILAWKRGASSIDRLLAAAEISHFQQEYVKGDNTGSFRAVVRLAVAEETVQAEIERMAAEQEAARARVYVLIALAIAALLGLVIYGVRLDTRTRGYLTWQIRFGGLSVAAIVLLVLYALL